MRTPSYHDYQKMARIGLKKLSHLTKPMPVTKIEPRMHMHNHAWEN